jgi:hypothetical protein
MIVAGKYLTEDGCIVNQYDPVWEIRYEWLNWEISLAYPARTCIRDLPAGAKVWKEQLNAVQVCHCKNVPKKEVWL